MTREPILGYSLTDNPFFKLSYVLAGLLITGIPLLGLGLWLRTSISTFSAYCIFYGLYKLLSTLIFMGSWVGGLKIKVGLVAAWNAYALIVTASYLIIEQRKQNTCFETFKDEQFYQSATESLGIPQADGTQCPKCKNKTVGQDWCVYCGYRFPKTAPRTKEPGSYQDSSDDSFEKRLKDL